MIEPAYRAVDPNNRGGIRGAKGISFQDHEVAIANSNAVFRYDSDWKLLGTLCHPSCAGIHDLLHEGSSLWVTSARNDLVFQFDLAGHIVSHVSVREVFRELQYPSWKRPSPLSAEDIRNGKIDFRDPRTHAMEESDGAHVNSICRLPNGEMLVSGGILWTSTFNMLFQGKRYLQKAGLWPLVVGVNKSLRRLLRRRQPMHTALLAQPAYSSSVVLRRRQDQTWCVCLEVPKVAVPSHSLRQLSDGTTIYLNTSDGAIVHFDWSSGQVRSVTKVTEGFLRGAAELSNGVLVVGSMGELIFFDRVAGRVLDRLRVSEDPSESVFDVKEMPPHFAVLPVALPAPASPVDGPPALESARR